MKKTILIFLFLICCQNFLAQEKLVDSLYGVMEVQTEVYATKAGEDLIVDLYKPEKSKEKTPLILFMHGGGFSGGSPKNPQEVKFARIAAAKGYTVGLISYRLTRKDQSFGCDFEAEGKIETFKFAAEDFMDAVAFMKNNSEKFSIDPDKIIVGGSSAGAEAVLNAVYNPELMFQDSEKYRDIKFSAVISLAGALVDVRYLTQENVVPGIFFHGTADNLVPYGSASHHYCENEQPGYLILDGSKSIVQKLEELETSFLLYSFEDAGHEISGMPFDHLQQVFRFLNSVVFNNQKIQSKITL
ncbi:alpha/beta hydrolase [Salinimicrobium flavum]|uniref:Alpha/beta hydrolase n=1 Tax=Salinimicrobium flavum TaxID=1737065 RepID=A0ABW5IST3_9FLAO